MMMMMMMYFDAWSEIERGRRTLTDLGEDQDDFEEKGLHRVKANKAGHLLVADDEEEEAKEGDEREHRECLSKVDKGLEGSHEDGREEGNLLEDWRGGRHRKGQGCVVQEIKM